MEDVAFEDSPDSPGHKCPMCGKRAGWLNPPELDSVTLVFDRSKHSLRTFVMVCKNCGFVRFHAASKIVWG